MSLSNNWLTSNLNYQIFVLYYSRTKLWRKSWKERIGSFRNCKVGWPYKPISKFAICWTIYIYIFLEQPVKLESSFLICCFLLQAQILTFPVQKYWFIKFIILFYLHKSFFVLLDFLLVKTEKLYIAW